MEQPLHYPKERFASRAQMAQKLEQFVAEVFLMPLIKVPVISTLSLMKTSLIRLRIDGFNAGGDFK